MRRHRNSLTLLTLASYLLAVSVSALFHEHHHHDEDQPRPGVSAAHGDDGHECSICQFLAHKPAPAADVAPVGVSSPVHELLTAAPACVVRAIVTAWHSRAPPFAV
jgi:hypothetical protein